MWKSGRNAEKSKCRECLIMEREQLWKPKIPKSKIFRERLLIQRKKREIMITREDTHGGSGESVRIVVTLDSSNAHADEEAKHEHSAAQHLLQAKATIAKGKEKESERKARKNRNNNG